MERKSKSRERIFWHLIDKRFMMRFGIFEILSNLRPQSRNPRFTNSFI
jgi:hypothetical protein